MTTKIIALVGVVLFVISLQFYYRIDQGNKLASALNEEKKVYGMIGDDVPPPCTWDVQLTERVMAENKSQAIVVEAANSIDVSCESILALRAPGFDISPPKEEQKISLTTGNKGSLSWILTPRKTGTFDVTVSDILNTKIFGITVTDMFGLTATQAKTFSVVGGLFGPMFTVPWWIERFWNRRKQKQGGQKEENEV